MRHLTGLAAALLLAISSVAALAQDDDNHRLDEAWADAVEDQEPILTDAQFAALNTVAFQAAATKVCDGLTIDHDKFAAAVAEATTPAPEGMNDAQTDEWTTAVLIRFGMTYGLFLAEGNAEPTSFCASASELKDDTELTNVWE